MLSVAKHLDTPPHRPFATLSVTRWGEGGEAGKGGLLGVVGECDSDCSIVMPWPYPGDHPTPGRGQASPLL
jgi:hypothetical protein